MTAGTPTAAWSAPQLVRSLCRAGWGDTLDHRAGQGLRSVLRALVDLLPDGAAEGRVTAAQIADAAGLSVRWTRTRLHTLERLGLIRWQRGGVLEGRPRPGWIRLCKDQLAALVRCTRGRLDPRRNQRRDAARTRLQKLRCQTFLNRKPLSFHAELSSTLSPLRGGTVTGPVPPPPQLPLGDPMSMCRVCGLPPEGCDRSNRRLRFALQHPFDPVVPRTALVADVRPDRNHGPRPGWRTGTRPTPPPHPTLDLGQGQQR
jgi:hypothetical protein